MDAAEIKTETALGMKTSGESAEVLFDADAEQRIELTIKGTRNGKLTKHRVAHIFLPLTDEAFFKYEQKKRIVQKISGTDVLNIRTDDKSLDAAAWLWDELAIRREGYIEREDWREKTNLLDKRSAIENGLLACFVRETTEDLFEDDTLVDDADGGFSDEAVDEDALCTVRLDCLFNCKPQTVTHYFRPPSAHDFSDYNHLMRKADNLIDSRRGFRAKKQVAQLAIPSKARELAALYDRLATSSEGYTGRVPAFHKREAVLELFARDADVTEKN